jgi:hypothetical protein
LVHVDYTDKSRINSTQLRSNVKVIDPNISTIYNCPVLLPGKDEITSVFVAPRELGIKVGHVVTSKQAGGMMHKVNQTNHLGKGLSLIGCANVGLETFLHAGMLSISHDTDKTVDLELRKSKILI